MQIKINTPDNQVIETLKAMVAYWDGYCFPETLEPKKYKIEAGNLKSDPRGDISILFC